MLAVRVVAALAGLRERGGDLVLRRDRVELAYHHARRSEQDGVGGLRLWVDLHLPDKLAFLRISRRHANRDDAVFEVRVALKILDRDRSRSLPRTLYRDEHQLVLLQVLHREHHRWRDKGVSEFFDRDLLRKHAGHRTVGRERDGHGHRGTAHVVLRDQRLLGRTADLNVGHNRFFGLFSQGLSGH